MFDRMSINLEIIGSAIQLIKELGPPAITRNVGDQPDNTMEASLKDWLCLVYGDGIYIRHARQSRRSPCIGCMHLGHPGICSAEQLTQGPDAF